MTILFLIFPLLLFSQTWAEKTLVEMTLDEKIGQLFMAPICPLRGEDHQRDWENLLEKFHVGNAIVKQSDPITQVRCLNALQRKSERPLLIAADAEWGLAMRMSETIAFPRNRTLGAIQNLDLLYQFGEEIGKQAKRVGVHLILAPVADVNSNPENPIIGMRSFGEDPNHVADCVASVVQGIQQAGILACVKHFPGHGDTKVDSHIALPAILHGREELSAIELVPFRRAIQEGTAAVMTGHLLVPAIDPVRAATLSFPCLTELLQRELGFKGLIISDALNMKALFQSPEEKAILAFAAGLDLFLYGDHITDKVDQILRDEIPRAIAALKKEFLAGRFSEKELDLRVKKILEAKEKVGLPLSSQVQEEGLFEALHSENAFRLKKRLFQEAIVVEGEIFPLPKKTAYLMVGEGKGVSEHFGAVFPISSDLKEEEESELEQKLQSFDAVVIGIHQLGPQGQNYGFSPAFLHLVKTLSKSILCLFGTPYAIPFLSSSAPHLIAFENDIDAQAAVVEVLQEKFVEK